MAKKKKYYSRVSENSVAVEDLYKHGITKGEYVGFRSLENLMSIKLGATTYLMAQPTAGKTEFWFEILINLSEFYGWKHAIFSPESGNREEIIAELISKYCRKPFYDYEGRLTDDEKFRAIAWLDEHFFIIDPDDNDITPDDFFAIVSDLEKEYDIRVHTTTLDPYNELKNDLNGFGGRQDLYIETLLGMVRRNARVNRRHNCIITHCSDQVPITDSGVTFYPAPTARNYAGGQAWYRKGLQMIAMWRPPFGLCNSDGRPYEKNEVHIIIQKSKPKGVGEKGTAILFYDWKKNRYYENFEGMKFFSEKKRPKEIQTAMIPNVNFYESERNTSMPW